MVQAKIKGYVVPYDIPSENVNILKPDVRDTEEVKAKKRKYKDYVRAKRVQATYYLHSLGVLATNSVMLVPDSRKERIDKVVAMVESIYEEVNKQLDKEGFGPIGSPIIKKIPIVHTQLISFKDLAEKQLKVKLEKQIDNVASLIDKIQQGVEEAKVRKLTYQLYRSQRELADLESVATELGLATDNQFTLLSELIRQAIEILEGA